MLDIFACCALATAILQFIYSLIVGSFPFNAFLSGIFCCAGSAVLTSTLLIVFLIDSFVPVRMDALRESAPHPDTTTIIFFAVCLRLQISEGQESSKTPERAFVDYVLAMSTLFLAVWCYIG